MFSLAWTMIAVPLLSAAVLLLIGRAGDKWGHLLGCAASIYSFVIGAILFVQMLADPGTRSVNAKLYEWIGVGPWDVQMGLLIDQLSILFVLLITGVGSLIHIYSIGYMAHDERRRRFFGFLNLFVAAMLLLVLADNYLVLFIGWEGVGLASYLLIGFWQAKPSAAAAAKKAFVVNRVGDIGMALAMSTMFATFGSVTFSQVNESAKGMATAQGTLFGSGAATATAIGLFLLLAACGKSAQVPLQSWLLDAMEGPTPVSALIHAATMVTAGVYLVTRSHAIYAETPVAGMAVVIVGTVTLLAGAWIGTSKDDIKKALAGSTMSQIGYMMLAAGIGPAAYPFAIFHLITHGFFKANMFLGAGSVMHGMNDDVDMRNYGRLSKFMKVTFLTFAMGYLAIIGVPGFSGSFSKDHIITAAFEFNLVVGICALVGALITAYYMTRMMMMTFWGKRRWVEPDEDNPNGFAVRHPHESPAVMTIPLIILAVLSIIGGFLLNGFIGEWLAPAVGGEEVHAAPWYEGFISPIGIITIVAVAIGVFLGWWVFRGDVPVYAPSGNALERAARADLYGDALNDAVVVGPTMGLARGIAEFDDKGVDGAVNGTAATFGGLSTQIRRLQTGYVRSYALMMVAGAVLVGAVLILGQLA
ncbi:NADH-quinone oxidoreductase subunit L [Enemella evansiae]|uniref:NADH-quinone oxidoreductase subunit L n=1 Tax=Enemella evansiae TaxID=2016499 RepID=UPI000B96D0C2|nr:NADH-quinone oxidoreductase subunit L [Enemella evansiae]OYO09434.1 NADH-quinone oxidoreductase subunit L [Enemella evansiae]